MQRVFQRPPEHPFPPRVKLRRCSSHFPHPSFPVPSHLPVDLLVDLEDPRTGASEPSILTDALFHAARANAPQSLVTPRDWPRPWSWTSSDYPGAIPLPLGAPDSSNQKNNSTKCIESLPSASSHYAPHGLHPARGPGPPSPARRLLPGRRAGAASARDVEAPAGDGLRPERAPGAGEAAANGGAGAGERSPTRSAAGTLTGRGARGGLIQGHLRPGRTGPDGAVTESESAGQPAGPVRLSGTARASAVSLPPDGARGPQLRRMPPPGPHPFPGPPPPLHPLPLPPPPNPHRNGKYLPGRGEAAARLSEGQPTVTNSRRGSGGAGFLAANPKACRWRPKEGGWELELSGPGVREVRPLGYALCAAAILESGRSGGGRVRPGGKGGASQMGDMRSRGLEGRSKADPRGGVGGGESLGLSRVTWSEKGQRWAWGRKVSLEVVGGGTLCPWFQLC